MTKRELHKLVNKEMVDADNKVVQLKRQLELITKDIEYWTRQADAARTVSIRLDLEADREAV